MGKNGNPVGVIVAPVHINGIEIVREMARKGARVTGVSPSSDAPGLRTRFLRERIISPSPGTAPGAFAELLLSRSDLYGAIVIPTDDFHVRDVAENYDRLATHYKLAVAPSAATATALDKAQTYKACHEVAVPCPRTRRVENESDLEEAAAATGFPAILRPAFSLSFHREFGVKSFYVSSLCEAREKFALADAAGHRMLFQEVIPGADEQVASCKVYATDSGDILGALAGFKLNIYPPSFGVSQMQETRPAPQIEENTARILSHIGFKGALASVEWKYDRRDATWKLLEINARAVMAIAIMKFAGVDVIEMLWRDKLGLPQLETTKPRYGRRWAYLKNGLLLLRHSQRKRRGFFGHLKLYRPPICFALMDVRDPWPFFHDIAPMLLRRIRRNSK